MDWRVLGPVEVLDDDGEPIALGGPKQLAVFVTLLVNPRRVVSTDELVEALYGDSIPNAARKSVQAYVARLRRALDHGAGGADHLRSVPAGYIFEPGSSEVDSVRFERLVAEARPLVESDPDGAAQLLEDGLALWRGRPFENVHATPELDLEARRLDEVRLGALADLAESQLRRGRVHAVLPDLQALVASHPLHERLRVLLVLALYQAGRQADALRAAAQVRSMLGEQLGIEPSRELRDLEQRILEQDPELDRPRRPWLSRRRRRVRAVWVLGGLAAIALLAAGTRTFVARDVAQPRISERHLLPPGSTAAVAGGGSIWVIVPDASMVVSVDPDTGKAAEFPLAHEPSALAAGLGSVWVASERSGHIIRMAATTGHVQGEANGLNLDGAALAVGRDSLWVVREDIDPIIRLDPDDMSVVPVDFPSSIPPVLPSISVDSDIVWASNSDIGRVGWHDTGSAVSGFAGDARLGAHGARSIVASAGFVWFSQPTNGTITRVDEESREVTTVVEVGNASGAAFPLLRQPYAMAAGPGGLWVAIPEDGRVLRLDETTGEITATLSLGEPTSIFAAAGAVWVLDRQLTQLVRIDPETCDRLPLMGPGADLRGCDLSETLLLGLDLSNADLRWADLGSVIMDGADLTGADLRGAEVRRARMGRVTWQSTRCPDGSWSDDAVNSCRGHLIP